jgi:hypothetical protein
MLQDTANQNVAQSPAVYYPSLDEFAWDPYDEPDESELEVSVTGMGYSAGGSQLRESRESRSSSSREAGRLELSALQHDCTNPQRMSEKPKASA